ncbi:MAG: hypothetical protein AAF488_05405 [Planctomycetota bacterium]
MILVIIFGVGLLFMTLMTVDMSKTHAVANRVTREAYVARQIAESAAAQALARIKQGGIVQPMSGGGGSDVWVQFGDGEFIYTTDYDATNLVSTVRAWGRVPVDPTVSGSVVAPDHANWDGSGYIVRGVELAVRALKYVPDYPLYFGNGGIERPLGGFDWSGGTDPADPSTWGTVSSSPASFQSSSLPFTVSALDHPYDYLYGGGTPTAAGGGYHDFNIWAAQNPIGQFNIDAWFTSSAGSGVDPTANVTPAPSSSAYDITTLGSDHHPYPIDSEIADVQTFAWALWNNFGTSGASNVILLDQGSHSGDFGTLADPKVTFVTGKLTVSGGDLFRGSGILVIRDDYDPNLHSNNTPSTRSSLKIQGDLEWTGLVIVAGWAPSIDVDSSGSLKIVGSLFGEDSVQSGGEVSLDSATIVLQVDGPFEMFYSRSIFQPGGLIFDLMPEVRKEIVGVRALE